MTDQLIHRRLRVTPLGNALGATVEGLDPETLDGEEPDQDVIDELRDAWSAHLVLLFPQIDLSPAQQVRLARVFGPKLAATTETGGDYRGVPTLAGRGFPELLVLDTANGHRPQVTNVWHTDVTFIDSPPIGSLFCMEIPARSGGDTVWTNQYLAYDGLSAAIRTLIDGLSAVHGRPPATATAVHPIVKTHPVTGRRLLYVNRGWTRKVKGLHDAESRHLLEMLFERAERPEYQVRWHWSAGDAALWDNRCTMHYALADYGDERRAARRATIYDA